MRTKKVLSKAKEHVRVLKANIHQKIIFFASLIFFAVSCDTQNGGMTLTKNTGTVDLILTNGKIITVDDEFSILNTVVVDDGRIIETGGAELALEYQSDETVDLQGKVLMPGFNDSHTHIRGRPQRYIAVSYTHLRAHET